MAGAEAVSSVEGLGGGGLSGELEELLKGMGGFQKREQGEGLFGGEGLAGEVDTESVQGGVFLFGRGGEGGIEEFEGGMNLAVERKACGGIGGGVRIESLEVEGKALKEQKGIGFGGEMEKVFHDGGFEGTEAGDTVEVSGGDHVTAVQHFVQEEVDGFGFGCILFAADEGMGGEDTAEVGGNAEEGVGS